jgi:hypothetical protein
VTTLEIRTDAREALVDIGPALSEVITVRGPGGLR